MNSIPDFLFGLLCGLLALPCFLWGVKQYLIQRFGLDTLRKLGSAIDREETK